MKEEELLQNNINNNVRRNHSVGGPNNDNDIDYNVEQFENEINNQNENNDNNDNNDDNDNNDNQNNINIEENLNVELEQENANNRNNNNDNEHENEAGEEVNEADNDLEEDIVRPNNNPDNDANIAEIERLKKNELRLKRENDELRRKQEELEAENAQLKNAVPKKKGKPKKEKDDRSAEDRGYKVLDGNDKFGETVSGQAGKVNRLKHLVRKMNQGVVGQYGKSSTSYRKVAKDLNALDEFMKEIDGRTKLTAEEMETYDKLSLNVYKSSKEYLEKKARENTVEADEDGIDVTVGTEEVHMSPKNEYERTRIRTIEKIQNDIQTMRQEMFANQIAEKKDEMSKGFAQGKMDEELAREQMVGKSGAELKSSMEESIAKSLFYDNRIKSLEKANDFTLKAGETFVGAMNRLDKSTVPSEDDISNILENDSTKKIVEAGMKKQAEGSALKSSDIAEMLKADEMKQGDAIREQNQRNNNMRKISDPTVKKNEPVLNNNPVK